MLLESVVPDLLDVLLRHDPPGAGRWCPVERHEVGPRLLEPEPDALGIDDLHGGDPSLERAGRRPAIALEAELHVLGGHRLALVGLYAPAKDELLDQARGRRVPRLREAGRHLSVRHWR